MVKVCHYFLILILPQLDWKCNAQSFHLLDSKEVQNASSNK